jgi:hypothetical protein
MNNSDATGFDGNYSSKISCTPNPTHTGYVSILFKKKPGLMQINSPALIPSYSTVD